MGVTVGDAKIDDSKLKKSVLARGVDELFMTADDACADMDAHATAPPFGRSRSARSASTTSSSAATALLDNYAQQVDVQLAAKLGLPLSTALPRSSSVPALQPSSVFSKTLSETVEVPLPAVISCHVPTSLCPAFRA